MQSMLILFYTSFLLLEYVYGTTIFNNANNKKLNNINQQNLQTLLSSIEERLWKVDQIYSMQFVPNVEVKLENVLRKLDTIELKMERLEMKFMSEIEKVSSNISNKIYKDEIIKEHILRKLTDVYDRLNHKLIYTELKFEMNHKKIEDKLKIIMKELHKNNENILTGLMDTETELEDALTGIDEIRASQLNTESFVKNITAFTANIFQQIQTGVNDNHENLLDIIDDINATYWNILAENRAINRENFEKFHEQFDNSEETLNNYFNKITNMNEETWNKNVKMDDRLQSIGLILNETRNEQQNGLRILTVQVGRMNDRKNNSNKLGPAEIENIEEKLSLIINNDANLEDLIATQNMFLENCYRVQMDESRLEKKISIVLQKLIDTFEEKTTCEPKNLQIIEQNLKTHDSSIKKILNVINNYHTKLENDNETNDSPLRRKLSEEIFDSLEENTTAKNKVQKSGWFNVIASEDVNEVEDEAVEIETVKNEIDGNVKESEEVKIQDEIEVASDASTIN